MQTIEATSIEATSLKKPRLCPSFLSQSKKWTGICPLNYGFWKFSLCFCRKRPR